MRNAEYGVRNWGELGLTHRDVQGIWSGGKNAPKHISRLILFNVNPANSLLLA